MKFAKHKDFDSFLDAIPPAEQAICVRMRGLILENFPELSEKFAYGAPYYHRHSRVCFLYPANLPYSGLTSGVSFGLVRGHLLSNEHGLLEMGTRKEVGYVLLHSVQDIREEIFLEMLHEAILVDAEIADQKKNASTKIYKKF